ncbi:MAG: AI-2E family transporter [Patescibacteria group bacterium]|nr:AI-2E family transporter [Patescibacteria group bacterium]MCL5431490.1 AI-2E family transporter [Patescibacteria group bacterium]
MKVESRHLVYLTVVVVTVVLAYLARAVLTPFILAALAAYLLNPLVNWLTHRARMPRTLAILLIYTVTIGLLVAAGLNLALRLSEESTEFLRETHVFLNQAELQITTLPDWLVPAARDTLTSARTSLTLPGGRMTTYIPGAINRTVSLLIFLVATFYFLRDGSQFTKNLPKEVEIVRGKIGKVLGDYLRGQLLLVAIMSLATYIGLLIIGVRFVLILSVFTGLAEIVPFVGPLVAAGVAVIVAFTDQASRISANPFIDAVAVAALYTVLRQLEDLFVIPQVMGRMVKLHPLIILAVVIVGGHLFGVVGYLVAVPVVASVRVILDHIKAP